MLLTVIISSTFDIRANNLLQDYYLSEDWTMGLIMFLLKLCRLERQYHRIHTSVP